MDYCDATNIQRKTYLLPQEVLKKTKIIDISNASTYIYEQIEIELIKKYSLSTNMTIRGTTKLTYFLLTKHAIEKRQFFNSNNVEFM